MNRQLRKFGSGMALAAMGVQVALPATAWANPVNPTVVSGSASFSTSGSALTVTNTPGTIINWQGFSIGTQELTRFNQQSASSAVLNRVTGTESSQILGALQSNGQVYLINPAGVFFGAGARIDVAGLVATSLNISDADFLGGRLNFQGTAGAGATVNQGTISTPLGGKVILVGTTVENSGTINAPDGQVVLAAGTGVVLGDTAAPNVLVQIQATDNKASNSGLIAVGNGTAGIYGALVQQSGIVRADSATTDAAGNIVFRATQDVTLDAGSVTSASGGTGGSVIVEAGGTTLVSGNVAATGIAGNGGTVQLLGHNVGVIGNAVVDASGTTGGGTILVGGDYKGANPAVTNADALFAGADTLLRADATDIGNGGKIVLWSESATQAYGAISARGGANGGTGGFVETSSRGYLEVTRTPEVGAGGTWLLDPTDITVTSTTGAMDSVCTGGSFSAACFAAFVPTTSTVSNSVINAALDAGTNVTISTGSTAIAPSSGTITINSDAPITKSTGALVTLTLSADNNISVLPAITSTGTSGGLSLVLNSGLGAATPAGSAILWNGMSLGLGSFTANKDATLYNVSYSLGGVFSVGGALTMGSNASLTLAAGSHSAGSLVLDPNLGGGLTITGVPGTYLNVGNVTVSDIDLGGGGVVRLDNLWLQNLGTGTFALDTHTVTLANGANISMPNLTMTSGLINGQGNLSIGANFIASGGAIDMTLSPAGTPSASYLSSVYLVRQDGGVLAGRPIRADSVQLSAQGTSSIDFAAVSSSVNANSLWLSQPGSIVINNPLTADSIALSASSAVGGSGITLNSTLTADSVTLYSDIGATFGPSTFAVRNPLATRLADLTITQRSGDFAIPFMLDADSVALRAEAGSILHGAGNLLDVRADKLDLASPNGTLGTSLSPLLTSVSSLAANYGFAAPSTALTPGWGVFVSNTLASGPLRIVSVNAGVNDVNITNNTNVLLSSPCPDGCLPGVSSWGGNITIQSGGSILNDPGLDQFGNPLPAAWISASGTASGVLFGQTNGNGGTVNLSAAGNINLPSGKIEANGVFPDANNGAGAGGSISLSAGGFVNVGMLSARGASWAGTYFFGTMPSPSLSLDGGGGGTVAITAGGGVAVDTIDVSGGAAISAQAWNGAAYVPFSGLTEAGGAGGTVTLNTGGNLLLGHFDVPLATWIGAGILADGGGGAANSSGNGGAGGAGGIVTINGSGAGMLFGMGPAPIGVSARGGIGGAVAGGGTGGVGGLGGQITVSNSTANLGVSGSFAVAGGNGGAGGIAGGNGGGGGTLTLQSLAGAVALDGVVIDAGAGIGGTGTAPGTNGAVGSAAIRAGGGGIVQTAAPNAQNGLDGLAVNTGELEVTATAPMTLGNAANSLIGLWGGTTAGNFVVHSQTSMVLGGATAGESLNVAGNLFVDVPTTQSVTVNNTVQAAGNVSFKADGFNVSAAGTLSSGTGTANYIEFLPLVNSTLTSTGNATLDRMFTPTLRVGDAGTSASILFGGSTPIILNNVGSLSIRTTGTVTQSAGAALQFGAANPGPKSLQVSASSVQLTDAGNDFSVLAGQAATSFQVADANGFALGTVDGVTGVNVGAGGTVGLTAVSGNIDVPIPVLSGANWTFTTPGGATNLFNVGFTAQSLSNSTGSMLNLSNATVNAPLANLGVLQAVSGVNSVGNIVNNSGTVNVVGGSLSLSAGSTGPGGYAVATGASLLLSGAAQTYGIGSLTGSGNLSLTGATANIAGATFAGTSVVDGGTLNVGGGSLGALTLGPTPGSTLNVAGGTTLTGVLANGGTVNVLGAVLDLGAGSSGTGSYAVGAGGTLSLSGAGQTYGIASLAGTGNLSVTGGTANVASIAMTGTSLVNGGTLNLGGGLLGALTVGPTAGSTLNVAGNTGVTGAVGNSGTVNVNGGVLQLSGGGTGPGGFAVAAGATLWLSGVGQTYGVSSLTGAGNLAVSGATANLASIGITGAGVVDGGALTLGAGSLGTLNLTPTAGSTLNVTGATTLAGALTNDGAVNVNTGGLLGLAAGSGGGGSYAIAAGATLALSGAATGYKLATVTSSGGTLDVAGNAGIGLLDQSAGGSILSSAGTGNLAVLDYVSGAGTIGGGFHDLLLASTGTLSLTGKTVSVANNLVLGAQNQLMLDGSTVSGTNVLLSAPAIVLTTTAAGTSVSATGAMAINAPTGLLLDGANGPATLSSGGPMVINAGDVGVLGGLFPASINAGAGVLLAASGNVLLRGGTGANASAEINGAKVGVVGNNVVLTGGSGSGAYAGINGTAGGALVLALNAISLAAGTGLDADAVVTSTGGKVAVVYGGACIGCNLLAGNPYGNGVNESGAHAADGAYALTLWQFMNIVADSSVAQANAMASSDGSGTSSVSNDPGTSSSSPKGDQNAARQNARKKLPVCR